MRKIAASYIFPVISPPIKNGILFVNDDGEIADLVDPGGQIVEMAGLEFYNGIIVPGFVNAHCHLELSHYLGKIEQGTGLGEFIGSINKLRKTDLLYDLEAAQKADEQMWHEGIVAVGDISNGISSVEVKRKSKLKYHTFAEVYGFSPDRAERAFSLAREVFDFCSFYDLPASIVPHAPYSVSNQLFSLIKDFAGKNNRPVSMHNQESEGENEFFKTGKGEIANHLQNNLGLDISEWRPTQKNSLPSVFARLPEKNNLLLVHNVFTDETDIQFLKSQRDPETLYFALCPNANKYISKSLPRLKLFRQYGLNLCLGTDSLASNSRLSILSEMKTIQDNFPEIKLEEMIRWATMNGAKALNFEKELGSFEPGKKPGVILLEEIDLQNLKILEVTRAKRLV